MPKRKKQSGGNPALLASLTAANEIAKVLKPATKLKGTKLGSVPIVKDVLEFLSQAGYGQADGFGNFVTVTNNDWSVERKRRLPILKNQGEMSIPSSSSYSSYGTGKMKGGGLKLFNY